MVEYSAKHYQIKCKKDREAVEALMPKIIEAAEKASFGNIGDIKYTTRTIVPNGGVWCDGAKYAKDDLADVYKMLTEGKLVSVDMATFDNVVSLNGSCGFFGLDDTGFKVPLLKDVYIKSGLIADEFGAESLPQHTHTRGSMEISGTLGAPITRNTETRNGGFSSVAGAFTAANKTTHIGYYTEGAANTSYAHDVTFKASNSWTGSTSNASGTTYQSGAKVNPDHVKYRAYVVLYTAEKEVSIADWTNQLEQKTSNGLSQIQNTTDSGLSQIQNKTDEGVEALTSLGGMPVGSVIAFAANSAPTGFVLCNGAAVSRTTYSKLFAVIGTTYGKGDGSTTFALPNLTDKFIQGSGTAGTSKAAGLPNITGTVANNVASLARLSGAFYQQTGQAGANGLAGAGSLTSTFGFDASRSNSIYGKSSTVQPPALTMRYYIKY